jgi:hypothetical protein
VAGELAQSPSYRVLENAFQADTPGNDDTVKGRQYGDAVRTGTVGPKAQEIGVNEFAAPEIGEGFATYSTPAGVSAEEGHEGNALDYSVHVDGLPRPRTWGYHFAGVVAASEDGRDKVTLENYNRADDIENYLQGVYEQLIITHTDIVREKIESLDQMEGIPFRSYFREVFQVIHQAQNLAAESEEQARQEAFDAYTNFMNNRNDGQAWFFQIYGSGAGQTFHERQAAGGSFTNPLTVRVGKVSENVTVLQATLNGLLDNVPGLVANVADPPTYAATLRNSKRQILARTTQADVKAEFNSALAILVRLRKHAIYAGAQAVGGTEGINNVPFDDTAPTFARQRIQTIRNGTGIFKFERKGVLDAKLARLGLMIPRIVQLTQYGVANVQV